jgi:hypothetical protein
MNPDSNRVPVQPVLRTLLRALLIVWAGFWAWFALAVAYGGAEAPPPWWIPAGMLAVLALLVLLAWKRPMAGGIALVAAGAAAASFFRHPATQALLAAPAILLGIGCLALRWRERRILGAACLALAFLLGS